MIFYIYYVLAVVHNCKLYIVDTPDSESDPLHLAWLIRPGQSSSAGRCSLGNVFQWNLIAFNDLNPNTICPPAQETTTDSTATSDDATTESDTSSASSCITSPDYELTTVAETETTLLPRLLQTSPNT